MEERVRERYIQKHMTEEKYSAEKNRHFHNSQNFRNRREKFNPSIIKRENIEHRRRDKNRPYIRREVDDDLSYGDSYSNEMDRFRDDRERRRPREDDYKFRHDDISEREEVSERPDKRDLYENIKPFNFLVILPKNYLRIIEEDYNYIIKEVKYLITSFYRSKKEHEI